jgi:hypothetical protein
MGGLKVRDEAKYEALLEKKKDRRAVSKVHSSIENRGRHYLTS